MLLFKFGLDRASRLPCEISLLANKYSYHAGIRPAVPTAHDKLDASPPNTNTQAYPVRVHRCCDFSTARFAANMQSCLVRRGIISPSSSCHHGLRQILHDCDVAGAWPSQVSRQCSRTISSAYAWRSPCRAMCSIISRGFI